EIRLFEIGLLVGFDRVGQRRRQCHARGGQLQRVPRGVGAASKFGEGQARFWRDAAGGQSVRNQQRRFARGVTQQPGDLFDREQLVYRGILMVDAAGQHTGQLVERGQQSLGRLHVFLGE